jgi:hypothetical protein
MQCQAALYGPALGALRSAERRAAGEEDAMIATLDRNQDRRQFIARRVASDYARDRVRKALYEALVEGLEFGPRDLPLADDREWVRGAIAAPMQEATEAAIEALVWSVDEALERAPNGLFDRYIRSHNLRELGIE